MNTEDIQTAVSLGFEKAAKKFPHSPGVLAHDLRKGLEVIKSLMPGGTFDYSETKPGNGILFMPENPKLAGEQGFMKIKIYDSGAINVDGKAVDMSEGPDAALANIIATVAEKALMTESSRQKVQTKHKTAAANRGPA